jgi:hypothetical protein
MNNNLSFDAVTVTNTQALSAIGMDQYSNFVVQYAVTVNTPSAGTFTAAVTDICTKVAHNMATGLKVQVSTTTTLPAGLSAVTDYFVINLTADTFKLASSLAFALAGTAVDISTTGTGTHTVTPTAIAGGVLKMQESVDGQTWYDIASVTANITATVTALFQSTSKTLQIRPYFTLTAGQCSIVIKTNTKT